MLSISVNVIQILLKLVEFVSDPIKKNPKQTAKNRRKGEMFCIPKQQS